MHAVISSVFILQFFGNYMLYAGWSGWTQREKCNCEEYALEMKRECSEVHPDSQTCVNEILNGRTIEQTKTGEFCNCDVNRPPNIFRQPVFRYHKDMFFQSGQTARILCEADGNPKPEYYWKRNGETYNASGQGDRVFQLADEGTLHFKSAMEEDEGIYQCFADNGLGVSTSVKINLRMATLDKFSEDETATHRVEAGRSLSLPCTPPRSNPSPEIFWVFKDSGGSIQPVIFDDRVNMDIEGNLRLTNVKKSDELDGHAYSCMVINNMLRQMQVGPEHIVEVTGSADLGYPPTTMWTSPTDTLLVKGEKLRLQCIFAGNPSPLVTWRKLQEPLPDRARFQSYGQELIITDVQESDSGLYMCTGGNIMGRAVKTVNVSIESAPSWIEEPKSVEASIGEDVTFICKADGNPQPEIVWYINGVPLENGQVCKDTQHLDLNNRLVKNDTNAITLTNVALKDRMNIQCNASNKHGYVFSDVYLNILEGSPIIFKPPQSEIKVAEGKTVTLDCLSWGIPTPTIKWYKQKQRIITGGRLHILQNGNLHIKDVVMEDAGNYQCRAENIHGVATANCTVITRLKTRILQGPKDLIAVGGQNARFTCGGITDPNEMDTMKMYWEEDGKRLTSRARIMIRMEDTKYSSMTIKGAIVWDSGIYSCVITNGLDEDRASATLIVKERPDPPLAVTVERCFHSYVELKWIKGMENNDPIQYYIIEYNTSFNPDQWIMAERVDKYYSTTTIPLSPWENYTFRVTAVNNIGASRPSYHTENVCRTPPAIPDINPQNVRSVGDKRNFLKILWTPMNEMEQNGPGFRYTVAVRKREQLWWNTYTIDDWRDSSLEIQSYMPYTPYLVKVRASNHLGDAKEDPIEYTLFSFEDVPRVSPLAVEVEGVGNTFATVTWNWDPSWLEEQGEITLIRGQLKGFRIQSWKSNEKNSTFREVDISVADVMKKDPPSADMPIQASYLLKDLPANSIMQVQVCVTNNFNVGHPSEPKEFTTSERVNRPPIIIQQPSDKEILFKTEEAVRISCIADGIPEPRYIWNRNGEPYNPNDQGDRVVQLPNEGTLIFNSPVDKDDGVYQCFADNGYGISASNKIRLRKAVFKVFWKEPSRTLSATAGSALTIPCIPPWSWPPADVHWVLKEPGDSGEWNAITLDQRVTMDLEYRLRFTNVKKSDEQDGKAYVCMSMNHFLRINNLGPEQFVKVIGEEQQAHPTELWASPRDMLFLKGDTLRLKCIFAGNPTPDIDWKKLQGTFPNRTKLMSFGQELVISDVTESDAGEYECMGYNGVGTRIISVFNVRIQSAPYWIEEPKTIETYVNDKATFICKAGGDPTPVYRWYINGVQLAGVRDSRIYNNNRFNHQDATKIIFTNLTLEDHMNIQCNASNRYGYVFSDVYLNVLGESLTIIEFPPSVIDVTENTSLTLDCLVSGKPDPVITWYRNHSLITGERFEIMPNGSLSIQNLVMADAGEYFCRANNFYGEVTSPASNVQIRQITTTTTTTTVSSTTTTTTPEPTTAGITTPEPITETLPCCEEYGLDTSESDSYPIDDCIPCGNIFT